MTTTEPPRSGASLNRHRSKQDYSTPQDFINAVETRFGPLAFDLAASASNAKANHYLTKENDSLSTSWRNLGVIGTYWLNPPFNNIAPWAKKCAMEATHGVRILFLVPASVGSNWFAEFVNRHALVMFLRPRLSFDSIAPYPKDTMICEFGPGVTPGFECWKWK